MDRLWIMFPCLEYLRLYQVYFCKSHRYSGSIGLDFLSTLLGALQSRAANGVKVKRLDIRKAINLAHKDVERLKDTIDELYWDKCTSFQDLDYF